MRPINAGVSQPIYHSIRGDRMKTDNMIEIEKAFCGYTPTGRAYVPYTGNLTKQKELDICKKLIANGYRPGWFGDG